MTIRHPALSHRLARLAGMAIFCLVSNASQALEFGQLDAAKSTLAFTYRQMGAAIDGHFNKFSTDIKFNPAKVNLAKASLVVDLNSIDVGNDEGNGEVGKKIWFNTKVFPTARFVSTSIKAEGGDRYEVLGKLTIKDKTRDVSVPTTIKISGNTAQLDGTIVLKRLDFGIGEGIWADTDTLANEIPVKFHLVTTGH